MRKLWLVAIVLAAASLLAQQGPDTASAKAQNTMIGCIGGNSGNPLLVQEQEHRTYRLQGNTAAVQNYIGKLVKITGRLMPGTGPSVSGASETAPVFQVQTAQQLAGSCHSQSGRAASPATGKTGSQGDALNTTSTASQGQVTPAFETEAGRAQAPGAHTGLNAGGRQQPRNETATQGAPPNWEQTAQNPADAERIAQGAQRAELDNSQRQLGVNAQPVYTQKREGNQQPGQAGASQQGNTNVTAQKHEGEETGEEQHQTHPTLVGCLKAGGDGRQFFLTEQKSGRRYRLNGSAAELKDHANHLVEVVGKPAERKATPNAVAGADEGAFEVSGVQDLAPTCGAGQQH